MGEYVKRERYLQRLVERRDNGDVKIITGPRRSGKSFLLKTIYRDYLVSQSVPQENIIIVSLDLDILCNIVTKLVLVNCHYLLFATNIMTKVNLP